MKICVKTLQGKTFQIEIERTDTVAKLKSAIEEQQGAGFPASLQKLIFSGKVLKDDGLLSEWDIKENDFIVCMVTKPKAVKPPTVAVPVTPSPAAAPAPAPAPASATLNQSSTAEPNRPSAQSTNNGSTTTTTTSGSSATVGTTSPSSNVIPPSGSVANERTATPQSGLVVGEDLNAAVRQLCDMGFPEDQVQAALRAAFNNPERAVEYLMNGIPTNIGIPPSNNTTTRPPTGDNASSGSVSGNPLEALRLHPQFPALRQLVQSNPSALPGVMRQIGAQSPELLQIINQNQDAFIQLLNEPDTNAPVATPQQSAIPGSPFGGATPDPQQIIQMINSLPPEQQHQMAAQMGIDTEQLQQMAQMMASFPPEQVQQAFSRAGRMGSSPGYHTVQLTEDEAAAVTRLTEMGFEHNDVVQAYLACDKNESLAANLLMDSMAAEFESAEASSGGDSQSGDNDDIYQ